jgi:hypothetical protein
MRWIRYEKGARTMKRYNMVDHGHAEMWECDDGEYVEYKDIEGLEKRIEGIKTFTKKDILDAFKGKENIPDYVKILREDEEKFFAEKFIYNNKKCVAIRTPRDGCFCIKVEIPEGCTMDDLNLQASFGNGYIDMGKL